MKQELNHLASDSASASNGHRTVDDASPRITLGLEAAADGKPEGAEKFLGFVQDEIVAMMTMSLLPEPIKQRLKIVFTEAMCARAFIEGYIANQPQPKNEWRVVGSDIDPAKVATQIIADLKTKLRTKTKKKKRRTKTQK